MKKSFENAALVCLLSVTLGVVGIMLAAALASKLFFIGACALILIGFGVSFYIMED